MKRPNKIAWLVGGGLALLLGVNIMFTTWLTELLQLPLIVYNTPHSADVVIVLGAGARKSGEPLPPQAKERIQRGYDLIRQGYAPIMIVAGGLSRQSGYVEADLMKTYAISLGLPAEKIVMEDQSQNTWANAVNSLAIMRRNDWTSALVVTSPYHTLRACAMFHQLHATVRCIAAPLNLIPTMTVYEHLTDFRSVVREYGALVYYVIKHF